MLEEEELKSIEAREIDDKKKDLSDSETFFSSNTKSSKV